jgi:hypothetical protein
MTKSMDALFDGSDAHMLGDLDEAKAVCKKGECMTKVTLFDQDMDGYMAPSEEGQWVRIEDYAKLETKLETKLTEARAEVERLTKEQSDTKVDVEPVMIYHGGCTIDCGEHGHHNMEMLKLIPDGTKLYDASALTELRQENERLRDALESVANMSEEASIARYARAELEGTK